MKNPKKLEQHKYMGRSCVFTAEYYRDYLKKKVYHHNFCSNSEEIPVRWKIQTHLQQLGWIVGFGFVFNGDIIQDSEGKGFRATKRINYVRVRKTPTSIELKIPMKYIQVL